MSKKYILFGNPVISIDTKKIEQIGNYKNNGKILCKKKNPIEVNVYDFEKTKAVPYGVYDIDKTQVLQMLRQAMTHRPLLWKALGVGGLIWAGKNIQTAKRY